MIRTVLITTALLVSVASCANKSEIDSGKSFAPASFNISDVFVNMVDGIESSQSVRSLMRNASRNTAKLYNKGMSSSGGTYPLEIEVTDLNYRDPGSSAASGDRTYIKYTMTLREQASGLVFRDLPVTYYHVSAGALHNDEAKRNAAKNMIRLSLKGAFARIYGMPGVPSHVRSHFNTRDIFTNEPNSIKKPKPKVGPKPVETPVAQAQPQVKASASRVNSAQQAQVIQASSTGDDALVIKCVVC
jgi:hypothetical protein